MPSKHTVRVTLDSSGVKRGAKRGEDALDRLGRKANAAQGGLQKAGAGMMALKAAVVAGAVAMTAFGVAVGVVTAKMAQFTDSMAAVKAVTQANAKEMAALTARAKELGATTRFSASQAAEGMKFLGMAGFDTAEILEAVPAALNLAAAAAIDLGASADITSNIMAAFGLKNEEAAYATDVLARIASNANTDISQMGDAMKFVGPIAKGLGVAMDDTAAAIGVLSNAGLQGSMAGTGLRKVMQSLVLPTKKVTSELKTLGLETVNWAELLQQEGGLTKALRMLDEAGLDAAGALTIAGARGGPALEVLTSNIPMLEKMNIAVRDTSITAEGMAKTMEDSVGGALRSFKSRMEAVVIAMGEGMEPGLRKVIAALTDTAAGSLEGAKALGDKMGGALEALGTTIAFVTENINHLVNAIKALIVVGLLKWLVGVGAAAGIAASAVEVLALAGWGLFAAVEALQVGFVKLTAIMLANPYVLLAAAVGLVTFAIFESIDAQEDYVAAMDDIETRLFAVTEASKIASREITRMGEEAFKQEALQRMLATNQALLQIEADIAEVQRRGIDPSDNRLTRLIDERNRLTGVLDDQRKKYIGLNKATEDQRKLDDALTRAAQAEWKELDRLAKEAEDVSASLTGMARKTAIANEAMRRLAAGIPKKEVEAFITIASEMDGLGFGSEQMKALVEEAVKLGLAEEELKKLLGHIKKGPGSIDKFKTAMKEAADETNRLKEALELLTLVQTGSLDQKYLDELLKAARELNSPTLWDAQVQKLAEIRYNQQELNDAYEEGNRILGLTQDQLDKFNERLKKQREEYEKGNEKRVVDTKDKIDDATLAFQGWLNVAVQIGNALDNNNSKIGQAIQGMSQIYAGWQAIGQSQNFAGAAMGGAQVGAGVWATGSSLGGGWQGAGGTGIYGGGLSGDYADTGAQVGGVVGAIVGAFFGAPQVGALIGSVLGGVIGGAISRGADEAVAQISLAAGEAAAKIEKAEGDMGRAIGNAAENITDTVNDIVTAIGGTIDSMSNMWVKIRDDIITVFVNGISQTFSDMGDALDFAVTQLLQTAQISGAPQEVIQAIASGAADSIEELIANIDFGQMVHEFGMNEAAIAFEQLTREFGVMRKKAEELGISLKKINEEESRRLQTLRDQITGAPGQSERQLREAQARAFNRELEREKAALEAQAAAMEAQIAIATGMVQVIDVTSLALLDLGVAAGFLSGATKQSVDEMIAQHNALLKRIERLPKPIKMEEIRIGGGGQKKADRERLAGILETFNFAPVLSSFIDLDGQVEYTATKLSDFDLAMLQINNRWDEAERLAHGSADMLAKVNAAREHEIELLRQQRLESFQESRDAFIDTSTDLEKAFNAVREEADRLIQEISDLNNGLEDLGAAAQKSLDDITQAELERIDLLMKQGIANLFGELARYVNDTELAAKLKKKMETINFILRYHQLKAEWAILKAMLLSSQAAGTGIADMFSALTGGVTGTFSAIAQGLALTFDTVVQGMGQVVGAYGDAVDGDGDDPFNIDNIIALGDEAFGWIEDHWQEILDGIVGGLDDVGGGTGIGGPGGGIDQAQADMDRLLGMLERWEELELSPAERELARINEQYQEMLDLAGNNATMIARVQRAYAIAIEDFWDRMMQPLRDFRESLDFSRYSNLSPEQQLQRAQADFNRLAQAAASGDLEALAELPRAAQTLLDIASQFFASGRGFQNIFDLVTGTVDAVLNGDAIPGGGGGDWGTKPPGDSDDIIRDSYGNAFTKQGMTDSVRDGVREAFGFTAGADNDSYADRQHEDMEELKEVIREAERGESGSRG
jgi:TP901 family phage tail tape measure protein